MLSLKKVTMQNYVLRKLDMVNDSTFGHRPVEMILRHALSLKCALYSTCAHAWRGFGARFEVFKKQIPDGMI